MITDAPVIAALIAAIASFALSTFNMWHSLGTEARTVHRKALDTEIPKLSTALHEIMAVSRILVKTRTVEAQKRLDAKGLEAKEALLAARGNLRYPLWGVADALKTLSRLPSWAQHAKRFPTHSTELLAAGDALREALDSAIMYSLEEGCRPSIFKRWKVVRKEKRLLHVYSVFRRGKNEK